MSDQELRELRRLAEEQGDAASWSRLARALVRIERWEDAGEALVRARAVGEADPAVEDMLEDASLDAAILTRHSPDASLEPADPTTESPFRGCLAWSPDGRELFGYASGEIRRARAPDWTLTPIAQTGSLAVTALACSLDKTTLYASSPALQTRNAFVTSLDLATGVRRRQHVFPAPPGSELCVVRELACWRADAWVFASDGERVRAFAFGEREESAPADASIERAPGTLRRLTCNGAPLEWPGAAFDISSRTSHPVYMAALGGIPFRWDHRASFPTSRAARALGPTEAKLARDLPLTRTRLGIAVSPSGRFVALFDAVEPEVELIDVVAKKARILRLERLPRNAVWAPSGRRLAIALTEGLAILELGADPFAALDAEWRTVLSDQRHDDAAFFARLEKDPRPAVTEWLLRQLEGKHDDPNLELRVASAARALSRRREPLGLERLARARASLPARPGFRDYRASVDRLVKIVESVRRGETCLCSVGFASPNDHGHLEQTSADIREGWGIFLYRCRACGRAWRVVEDAGYHFPTYQIEEVRD